MKILEWLEKAVIATLMILMFLVVVASTAEVSVLMFKSLANETPPRLGLDEFCPCWAVACSC